jgi:hypothetical protein
MKLTKRGEVVFGLLVVVGLLAVMGFCGWIEGGMQ